MQSIAEITIEVRRAIAVNLPVLFLMRLFLRPPVVSLLYYLVPCTLWPRAPLRKMLAEECWIISPALDMVLKYGEKRKKRCQSKPIMYATQ